jgi:hypothetical protein
MGNNNISFEDDCIRGEYARKISEILDYYNLRWRAFPHINKPEIFIRPKDSPEEILRKVSRVSLQVKDNTISLGVSGYYPKHVEDTRKILESKGYEFNQYRGYTKEGHLRGRWWLTKSVCNIESVVWEFKDIEPFITEKN